MITAEDIRKNPQVYRSLGPGAGYAYVGVPAMPASPKYEAETAMPPEGTEDNSRHRLQAPGNDHFVIMRWNIDAKAWMSENRMTSRRCGFTAEYLAAHGWRYAGAV